MNEKQLSLFIREKVFFPLDRKYVLAYRVDGRLNLEPCRDLDRCYQLLEERPFSSAAIYTKRGAVFRTFGEWVRPA